MRHKVGGSVLLTIEDKERELLNILTELGPGWHDRPEIAAKLNKKQLNPVEVAALDLLTKQGKVEQSTVATRRPHILRSVYRVKGE